MGGHIEQSVGRKHAVDAWRPEPVVPHVVVALEIHELHATLGEHDEAVCGFASIATVVMTPTDELGHHDLAGHLAGGDVSSLSAKLGLSERNRHLGLSQPDESVGDKEVRRIRHSRPHALRSTPQEFALCSRKGVELA